MLGLAAIAAMRLWGPTAPAQLAYRKLGTIEGRFPVLIGIEVENTGGEVAEVTSVKGECSFNYLIAGPGDLSHVPEDFHWELHLANADQSTVQPGETKVILALLEWQLADVPLELLAVVQMSFGVEYNAEQLVRTKPIILVLGNTDEVQHGFVQGEIGFYAGHEKLADQIRALDGIRSDSAELLLQKLTQDHI